MRLRWTESAADDLQKISDYLLNRRLFMRHGLRAPSIMLQKS